MTLTLFPFEKSQKVEFALKVRYIPLSSKTKWPDNRPKKKVKLSSEDDFGD